MPQPNTIVAKSLKHYSNTNIYALPLGVLKGLVKVIHIKPIACGRADAASNMQWQTTAEAKAKDKWELKGC